MRILVVAPDHVWFERWCREEGENPRDMKFVLITESVAHKGLSRGIHRQRDDRFILLGQAPYDWRPIESKERNAKGEMVTVSVPASEVLQAALGPAGWYLEEAESL